MPQNASLLNSKKNTFLIIQSLPSWKGVIRFAMLSKL